MKKKFQVFVTRKGKWYFARCPEVPDAAASGKSKKEVLDQMKAILVKKFRPDDGLDDGGAPTPHPVSPPPGGPRGPVAAKVTLREIPEA
jgi:hypothetical protein